VLQQTSYHRISISVAEGNITPETPFPSSLGTTVPSFPYSAKHVISRLENTQSGTPSSSSERRSSFCGGLGSSIVVFCWPHYNSDPSWPNYCKGLCTQAVCVIRCSQWSRRYFRKTIQFSKEIMLTFTELEPFNHGGELQLLRSNSIAIYEHHCTTLIGVRDQCGEQISTSTISKARKCSSKII
jgi:hypothetical protein